MLALADDAALARIEIAATRFRRRRRAAPLGYFVIIRRGGALGVCSAGETTNVTQAFHPSGRFWLPNSQ
jgi:hypothetical protein